MGANFLGKVKQAIQNSSGGSSKLFRVASGGKAKVRFLKSFDEGFSIKVHTDWDKGTKLICRKSMGEDTCSICKDNSLKTKEFFVWPVWDYEREEVKLFAFVANKCSPIPALVSVVEELDSLTDQDIVIKKTGNGFDVAYQILPSQVKPFAIKCKVPNMDQMLEILDKAFSYAGGVEDEDDDEDEEDEPVKPTKKVSKPKAAKADEDDEADYSEMSAKELFNLCTERKIKVKPKMDADWYIEKLVTWDEEQENGEEPW